MSNQNQEAQQALERGRELLRQFVEHAPAPIAMFDRDMKYIMTSRRFLTDYNLKSQDLIGRSYYEVFPEIPERWKEIHRRCLAGATERAEEDPFPRADGTLDWVRWEIQPWYEESGTIGGIILFSEVITERERAEEALHDSERRYHEFITGLPVAAYATDVAGRITLYNDAAVALWGRRPEPSDRWWGGSSKLYTRDGALLTHSQCPMAMAIREHRPFHGFEAVFEQPDGTRVNVLANITPVTDDSGRLVGATNVMLDITERKQAERALAESERLRRSILESVEEGIHGLDITGHIVFENPAALKMFGWQAQEMIGQHAHTLMHHHRPDGGIYPVEECPVYRALHDGQTRHVDNEVFFRRDGTSFPVEYTCSALVDDSGAIAGVVVSFRDITAFQRLEAQFFQSQKLEAVGELAGGIAHDFNNNLSAILGFSDLALDRLRPEDPVYRYLTQVKKAGEQSASLTRQLLAFSRKQLLQPKVLDLNVLITEMTMMLQRMIGENIELRLLLYPELGRVKADPGQVEQVLMNLVVNARDAMPDGGTLTLQTSNVEFNEAEASARPPVLAGPYIRLTVADTGCGMNAEIQARIFEPFFTTKELGKGTGLGLSTVYGIIKQSQGYIWVDSTLGQGTIFQIDLPRVEAPLDVTQFPEAMTDSRRSVATILLVDDDEMVRAIARETLQAQGYTVLEALNGGGALLIAERHQGRSIWC